jgi:uncharacterized protein YcgI (DUF1989 family)
MFFLQLTLSLESKDFVSATVAHQSVSMSPTSSIGMCIKPRDENMQIATFYGNSSVSMTKIEGGNLMNHIKCFRHFNSSVSMTTIEGGNLMDHIKGLMHMPIDDVGDIDTDWCATVALTKSLLSNESVS